MPDLAVPRARRVLRADATGAAQTDARRMTCMSGARASAGVRIRRVDKVIKVDEALTGLLLRLRASDRWITKDGRHTGSTHKVPELTVLPSDRVRCFSCRRRRRPPPPPPPRPHVSSRVLERNHAVAAVVLPVRSLGHADGHHQQRNLALVPRRDRSLDLVRLERTHERRAET